MFNVIKVRKSCIMRSREWQWLGVYGEDIFNSMRIVARDCAEYLLMLSLEMERKIYPFPDGANDETIKKVITERIGLMDNWFEQS